MPLPFQIAPPTGVVPNPLDFSFWFGDAPPVIHEQGVDFTKPGADGAGVQKVGRHHPAIDVVLESHWPSVTAAMTTGIQNYRKVPNSGVCNLTWGGVNWSNLKMGAVVLSMDMLSFQSVVYLLHNTYSYPNGTKLLTRWRLLPVELP